MSIRFPTHWGKKNINQVHSPPGTGNTGPMDFQLFYRPNTLDMRYMNCILHRCIRYNECSCCHPHNPCLGSLTVNLFFRHLSKKKPRSAVLMVVSRGESRNTDGRFVGPEKNKVEKSVMIVVVMVIQRQIKKIKNKCRRVSDSQKNILPLFDVDWCAN